ncbi:uncharacterized protein LOC126687979 [Mercurialis annua]|uniref:uncharacterized protein LOC126687979 n=1 Tax=Mercurialis annua TaxID=3986 RepID=UPI00215FAE92|nr:uncharacterized protein LOC126687979 [Mercurialis annua]
MDPCERLNCSGFSNSMKDFSNFINSSSLFEVPLQGVSSLEVISDWGPKPFKSINAWWFHPHFFSLIDSSWAVISESIAKRNLVAKLKELRLVIKIWNKNHFGDLNSKLGVVQKSITDLDYTADARPLDDSEMTLLSSLHVEFDKFGERNTKYYHSIASIRSRSNLISEIWVNNVLYSDPDDIKKHVLSFYKNANYLTSPFLESDIFLALSSFDDNKSPGPRGSSAIVDFRPISLGNGIRKWVSKVLADRLAPALPSIISEFSWSFIISRLKRMNFDGSWINWISSLFSSSQLAVLVNGSPVENFFWRKQLRVCVLLFSKAISRGFIDGIQIEGYTNPVLLLQFADDTLVFILNDLEKVRNLRRILHCFELISGLEINFHKSSITGINMDDYSMSLAADILSCKIEHFPITYLGLPLSIKKLNVEQWDPIIHSFSTQLSSWRGSLLSPTGRLVLIKSVLSSLPVYYMCSFCAPPSVISYLEKFMRKFL